MVDIVRMERIALNEVHRDVQADRRCPRSYFPLLICKGTLSPYDEEIDIIPAPVRRSIPGEIAKPQKVSNAQAAAEVLGIENNSQELPRS